MCANVLIVLLIVSLTLPGCGRIPRTSTPSDPAAVLQVTETGSESPDTVSETIRMNNCGGKADVTQTADRSLTVTVEGAGSLGVDAQIIRANITARYAERTGVSKRIELTAPPGTDMEFTVVWTEHQWLGTVTSPVGSDEARYRARVPIAVELVASRDRGDDTCPKRDRVPSASSTDQAVPDPIPATARPSATASPTSVPATPTPALPIALENGQTFEDNGWSLTVSNFTYKTLRDVQFALTNNTGHLALIPGTFDGRIVADTGRLEAVVCFPTQPRDQFPQQEIELDAGSTVEFTIDFSDMSAWSKCYGPVFEPDTRGLFLVINDLGGIFREVHWYTEIPRP